MVHDEPRFRMPEESKSQKQSKKKEDKPEVVKKVVTPEQADVLKNVVNKIAHASLAEEEVKSSEPEGKTELLNLVLESLPEPEVKAKPRRRRVSAKATNSQTDSAE